MGNLAQMKNAFSVGWPIQWSLRRLLIVVFVAAFFACVHFNTVKRVVSIKSFEKLPIQLLEIQRVTDDSGGEFEIDAEYVAPGIMSVSVSREGSWRGGFIITQWYITLFGMEVEVPVPW